MNAYARGALAGAAAGLIGGAAMAAGTKVEQAATGRPNSYVPARTVAHLLGLSDPDSDRWTRNMLMHYMAGATAGAVRGVMAAANLRGPLASLMHAPLRLSLDQTLENATGVGAPPWTWPRDELVVDMGAKTLYALVTGAVADALVEPASKSSVRRAALGSRRKGFA